MKNLIKYLAILCCLNISAQQTFQVDEYGLRRDLTASINTVNRAIGKAVISFELNDNLPQIPSSILVEIEMSTYVYGNSLNTIITTATMPPITVTATKLPNANLYATTVLLSSSILSELSTFPKRNLKYKVKLLSVAAPFSPSWTWPNGSTTNTIGALSTPYEISANMTNFDPFRNSNGMELIEANYVDQGCNSYVHASAALKLFTIGTDYEADMMLYEETDGGPILRETITAKGYGGYTVSSQAKGVDCDFTYPITLGKYYSVAVKNIKCYEMGTNTWAHLHDKDFWDLNIPYPLAVSGPDWQTDYFRPYGAFSGNYVSHREIIGKFEIPGLDFSTTEKTNPFFHRFIGTNPPSQFSATNPLKLNDIEDLELKIGKDWDQGPSVELKYSLELVECDKNFNEIGVVATENDIFSGIIPDFNVSPNMYYKKYFRDIFNGILTKKESVCDRKFKIKFIASIQECPNYGLRNVREEFYLDYSSFDFDLQVNTYNTYPGKKIEDIDCNTKLLTVSSCNPNLKLELTNFKYRNGIRYFVQLVDISTITCKPTSSVLWESTDVLFPNSGSTKTFNFTDIISKNNSSQNLLNAITNLTVLQGKELFLKFTIYSYCRTIEKYVKIKFNAPVTAATHKIMLLDIETSDLTLTTSFEKHRLFNNGTFVSPSLVNTYTNSSAPNSIISIGKNTGAVNIRSSNGIIDNSYFYIHEIDKTTGAFVKWIFNDKDVISFNTNSPTDPGVIFTPNITSYTSLNFDGSSNANFGYTKLTSEVFFTTNTNPNTTGTIFGSNMANLFNTIYSSTIDKSEWIWNGTIYIPYVATTGIVRFEASTNDPNDILTTFSPPTDKNRAIQYVSNGDNSLWRWNGTSYVQITATGTSNVLYKSLVDQSEWIWNSTANKFSPIKYVGSNNSEWIRKNGTFEPYTHNKTDILNPINGNITMGRYGFSKLYTDDYNNSLFNPILTFENSNDLTGYFSLQPNIMYKAYVLKGRAESKCPNVTPLDFTIYFTCMGYKNGSVWSQSSMNTKSLEKEKTTYNSVMVFYSDDKINLKLSLEEASHMTIDMYDMSGKKTALALADTEFEKGIHFQELSTSGIPRGVYILNINLNNEIKTQKIEIH